MAKSPAEIRSLARAQTEAAIRCLAGIMNEKKSPAAARVSAAEALLNRGWGKPTQPISGDDENPLRIIQKIETAIVDPHDSEKGSSEGL